MKQETWNFISGIALVASAIICIIAIYFQVKAYKKRKITQAAYAASLYIRMRNLDVKYPYPTSIDEAKKMHEEICTKMIFFADDLGKTLLCAKRDALHDYIKKHK